MAAARAFTQQAASNGDNGGRRLQPVYMSGAGSERDLWFQQDYRRIHVRLLLFPMCKFLDVEHIWLTSPEGQAESERLAHGKEYLTTFEQQYHAIRVVLAN